jgi:hypothetical protein
MNLLASMHSFKSSGDRKLETITPPSLSMTLIIFSRGSEESMVTSEGAMVVCLSDRTDNYWGMAHVLESQLVLIE